MAYATLDDKGLHYGDFDSDLINTWKADGKRVLLSIGGSQTDISYAFKNEGYFSLSGTLAQIVGENGLDGVEFELLSY